MGFEQENIEQETTVKISKPKYPWVLLILILITIASYFYLHKILQEGPSKESNVVAVVDVEALLKQHKDYSKLQKIEQEAKDIKGQLEVYKQEMSMMQLPEANSSMDPYKEALEDENALVTVKEEAQLRDESIAKRKQIAESVENDKKAALEKVNKKYGAAIISATLKLENADNMGLSKEQREVLTRDIKSLEAKRRQDVMSVEDAYEKIIQSKLSMWQAERAKELGIATASERSQLAALNASDEAKSQANNQKMADKLKKVMEIKASTMDLLVKLQGKETEVKLMRKSMLRDIASYATKIAIEKHLKLVMIKNIDNTEYPLDGAKVIKNAEDITSLVQKDLEAAGILVAPGKEVK